MLADALVCATLPTTDMERSRRFYEGALGLAESRLALEGGIYYEASGGTLLHVYETGASPGEHTVATFLVKDFEATIAQLRASGVSLEDVDLPGLTTVEGVWTVGDIRAAWIRDPDGNILGMRTY